VKPPAKFKACQNGARDFRDWIAVARKRGYQNLIKKPKLQEKAA